MGTQIKIQIQQPVRERLETGLPITAKRFARQREFFFLSAEEKVKLWVMYIQTLRQVGYIIDLHYFDKN